MSENVIKLGVNIDHVATLRQARRGAYPDLLSAADAALRGGADGITAHLREDRRHIQDADIVALATRCRLNLEMAATPEMVAIACGRGGDGVRPHAVCLVPEKRQELTTEGGLDVLLHVAHLTDVVGELKASGVIVSLFINPDPWQIEASARTGAEFVELHTGRYADAAPGESRTAEVRTLTQAASTARRLGLRVNAGHGLDLATVAGVLDLDGLEELNIGFSIIARAVFVGLETAVREMKAAIAVSPQ